MRKVIDNFRNSVLRNIMSITGLWWFLLHFINRHFICCVIGIIRYDQNCILHLGHKYRPDSLSLPAGWLKKGETPFEALKREVKEETNFEIAPIRILNVNSIKSRSHLEFIIEANFINSMFSPSMEVASYCWISKSAFKNHSFSDFNYL